MRARGSLKARRPVHNKSRPYVSFENAYVWNATKQQEEQAVEWRRERTDTFTSNLWCKLSRFSVKTYFGVSASWLNHVNGK